MTEQAPVCHIPPITPSDQPHPVNLPSIPPAQPNLQSLVNTVNQMRQVIMILAGQRGVQGPRGASGSSSSAQSKKSRFVEASRQTEKVKVYNPDDKTQFVEVERINQLTMRDVKTGENWTWDRNRG